MRKPGPAPDFPLHKVDNEASVSNSRIVKG
jgi:hypothetical protein